VVCFTLFFFSVYFYLYLTLLFYLKIAKHLSVEGLPYLFELQQHLVAKESISLSEHGSLLLSILVASSPSMKETRSREKVNEREKEKEKEKEKGEEGEENEKGIVEERETESSSARQSECVAALVASSLRQWPVAQPLHLLGPSILAIGQNADGSGIALQLANFLDQSAEKGLEVPTNVLDWLPTRIFGLQREFLLVYLKGSAPLTDFLKVEWRVGVEVVARNAGVLVEILREVTKHLVGGETYSGKVKGKYSQRHHLVVA